MKVFRVRSIIKQCTLSHFYATLYKKFYLVQSAGKIKKKAQEAKEAAEKKAEEIKQGDEVNRD